MNRRDWQVYPNWLRERRTGVGGSDAGPICGCAPLGWEKTLLHVFYDKLDILPERKETQRMKRGRQLEPAIGQMYEEEMKRSICRPAKQIMRHPKHDWMLASLDFETVAPEPPFRRVVECKNVDAFAAREFGESGSNDVPDHYQLQCQHYMAVTGYEACDLAALIGGNDFRVFHIRRNHSIIESLITIEEDFWRCVERREPPEPTWTHPATPRLIAGLYGVSELSVTLPAEAAELVKAYEDHGDIERLHKEGKSEAKARLLHLMGEAGVGYLPDGRMITRKQVTRKAYSVDESSYVDFRIKKGKVRQ